MAEISLVISKISGEFKFEIKQTNKFHADTFQYDCEKYFLFMTGVNFRFKSKEKQLNVNYVISEYERNGELFFKDFRGSFAGTIFNKQRGKWLIFTNHFGDQQIFYAQTKNSIFINSSIFKLSSLIKKFESISLDDESVYQLLSYGYFVGDRTLIKEIKKIEAGNYLQVFDGSIQVKEYHKLDNTPNYNLSRNDIVDGVDDYFRKAIKSEFDKDLVYGYQHLTTLSGGLDSRMVVWVAHALGYNNLINLTFSQSQHLDQIIAKEISDELLDQNVFVALDGGNHLIDTIDQTVYQSNALYYFSGASFLGQAKNYSPKSSGLVHTGMLGDGILSTKMTIEGYNNTGFVKPLSDKFLQKNNKEHLKSFKNDEIATMYVKYFNGILTSNAYLQSFSEVASPFLEVDFVNFCLSIPIEQRAHHKVYKDWIMKKYPEAAKFKWEAINARITDPSLIIRNKIIPVKQLANFAINGFFHNISRPINNTYSKSHMNPYNYWIKTNVALNKYFIDYFNEHIDLVKDRHIKEDCIDMFKLGDAIEKIQVLTLLSAINQFDV